MKSIYVLGAFLAIAAVPRSHRHRSPRRRNPTLRRSRRCTHSASAAAPPTRGVLRQKQALTQVAVR